MFSGRAAPDDTTKSCPPVWSEAEDGRALCWIGHGRLNGKWQELIGRNVGAFGGEENLRETIGTGVRAHAEL